MLGRAGALLALLWLRACLWGSQIGGGGFATAQERPCSQLTASPPPITLLPSHHTHQRQRDRGRRQRDGDDDQRRQRHRGHHDRERRGRGRPPRHGRRGLAAPPAAGAWRRPRPRPRRRRRRPDPQRHGRPRRPRRQPDRRRRQRHARRRRGPRRARRQRDARRQRPRPRPPQRHDRLLRGLIAKSRSCTCLDLFLCVFWRVCARAPRAPVGVKRKIRCRMQSSHSFPLSVVQPCVSSLCSEKGGEERRRWGNRS